MRSIHLIGSRTQSILYPLSFRLYIFPRGNEGTNFLHVILLTFRHNINHLNLINRPTINQSDLICRYRGRIQEFKSTTPMYIHPFVSHGKHIPNLGVQSRNYIFDSHPDNRGAFRNFWKVVNNRCCSTHCKVTRGQSFCATV